MTNTLKQAVLVAAGRPDVRLAVARLYQAVQEQIDQRRPICVVSGRCCRFEEFGHRLYVTTMELAAFVAKLGEPMVKAWDGTGCPFQLNKLCSVHSFRPFGCRIFFCDATATQWQEEQYAAFHAELRRLHEQFAVEYHYVEWREALRQLRIATPTSEKSQLPPA